MPASAPILRVAYIALATLSIAVILLQPLALSDDSCVAFAETRGLPPVEASAPIWQVESTGTHELYSNGLRVENTYTVPNEARFYQVLDRGNNMQPGIEWRSDPIGIVYHATESPQFPFEKDQNSNLQRVGRALVSHVQDKRSYNFVVDRFGRVFRIVEETDAANHAGNSVWADGRSVYLNLNSSFLAVAFETAADGINNAQVYAGRNLTRMLRSKYKIAAQNCVTHAQVSVNPLNMRIGYHTDWAARFPFSEMGLPNNYDVPLASLSDFGFEYDDVFRQAVGDQMWRGVTASERQVDRGAATLGISVDEYRGRLKERYKRLYSALKLTGALDESGR